MQQGTIVREHVKQAALAFIEYHWEVHGVRMKPQYQQLRWHAGVGWYIDGRLFPGTTETVCTYFDRLQREWRQKTADYRAGLEAAKVVIPKRERSQGR